MPSTAGHCAISTSGWRNFAPFFGADNVTTDQTLGTWTPILKDTPYLCAWGGGAGSIASIISVGTRVAYAIGIAAARA